MGCDENSEVHCGEAGNEAGQGWEKGHRPEGAARGV